MMKFNSNDITRLIRACKKYQDSTGSEYLWDEYEHLITKLQYYKEENCPDEQIVWSQIMSHNHNYEPMPDWVAWAGVGLMMFTVIIFVIFTLSVMYFG